MREFFKFITEPRVSILGGAGFVGFYELLQHQHWIEAFSVLSITAVATWLARR